MRLASPALLLAYGAAFAAAALGVSLPAFDDHPGQFYRLWFAATAGPAPWAWNAGWWAGYPELQFYPPGYFDLGAALHVVSLGALSLPAIYTVMAWVTYLAPGVGAFVLLARRLDDGWAALPGAFVALTLSGPVASGVEGGVHIGMLPARLAWALLPVTLLLLERWAGTGDRAPWAMVPVLAAVALTHPAHLPTAVAAVLLAAWIGPGARGRRLAIAAVVLGLAAALTAFWTLPLVLRLEHTRALAWGHLAVGEAVRQPLLAILVVAAAAGALMGTPGAADALVLRLPWLTALVVAIDAVVLEPLGLRWLPADRVADGAWMALVLAAGVVVGRLLLRLARPRPRAAPVLALGAVAVAVVLSVPGATLTLWPRAGAWPTYDATARGLRLPELWSALGAAPPGRALFVRSAVPLVFGQDWWRPHTHVTALAPLQSGRAIVNGTFTHPSPVAALVYRGSTGPAPVASLVERLDGRTLFGRPLQELGSGAFVETMARLGVSVVVALDEDRPRLRALDDGREFSPDPTIGPFLVWVRRSPAPIPESIGPGRWLLAVDGLPGSWVSARTTYYPLWHARRGGKPLQVRRGPAWDLEIRLDRDAGPVELIYAAGTAEKAGLGVSVAAVVGLGALVSRRRGRRAHGR